ncbi:MAG: hypothetical protein Q9160_002794 [Pyrenula sp. 1 TL-2023]
MATDPRLRRQAHFHVEVIRDTDPSPQGFQALTLPAGHPQAAYLASMPCPIFVANETVTSIRTQLAGSDAAELDRLVYAASLYYKHGLVVKMIGKDERITPQRPDGVLLVILRPDTGLTHPELIRIFGQQTFNNLRVGGYSRAIQQAAAEIEAIRLWDEYAAGEGNRRNPNRPRSPGPPGPPGILPAPPGFTTQAYGGTMPTPPATAAPTYGDINRYINEGLGRGGGAAPGPAPGPAPRPGGLQPSAPSFVPGGPSPGAPGGCGRGSGGPGGRGRAGSGEGRGGAGGA